MTITWSETAIEDFGRLTEYLLRFSQSGAERVSLAIADRLSLLDGSPGQGRMVPELGNPRVREVIVRRYRVWYQVFGEDLEVIAILHGAQDTRR